MVIVVDTSAWVDLFRDRPTRVAATLDRLIGQGADLAITEPIFMEVLAGATTGESLARVRAALLGRPILRLEGLADFEEAAHIYRICRGAGAMIRNQIDCLIAVSTIRHGASLLHNDRDFVAIARHTTLTLEALDGATPAGEHDIRERKGHWTRTSARSRGPGRAGARHARGVLSSTTSR